MILVDYSSVLHRMIFVSVSNFKKNNPNSELLTADFIGMVKHLLIDELINIETEHSGCYGDLVICLDDFSKRYWRKDFYKKYKENRSKGREESEINYSEVFEEVNELTHNILNHLPWKVVCIPGAEADDVILILAREYGNRGERILIHSPDKDLIQAQINNPMVKQYSSLTKKWIVPENKHESMDHWIMEHVFLGDESDNVPRVIDNTEFSDNFIEHLKSFGVKELTPYEFKNSSISKEEKEKIISSFNIYKTNKKGENTELDIYKKVPFGPSTLQKKIEQFGSIDNYLDSHPMYREHYERNKTLVLEEGIPNYIRNATIAEYMTVEKNYNKKEFLDYLEKNNLNALKSKLHKFEKEELTAENCGW